MIIKIVKIYLGLSLVLLWVLWGQFIFGQFLGPTYISQDLQAPSYVVGSSQGRSVNKLTAHQHCLQIHSLHSRILCIKGESFLLCESLFPLVKSSMLMKMNFTEEDYKTKSVGLSVGMNHTCQRACHLNFCVR